MTMKFKTVFAAAAIALGATAADAATHTINYQLSGLSGDLAALGLSSTDSIDVTVTYDDTSPYYYEGSYAGNYDYFYIYEYGSDVTTTYSFGGQSYTIDNSNYSNYDYLYVQDGEPGLSYDYFYHDAYGYTASGDYLYSYIYGYDYYYYNSGTYGDAFDGLSPTGSMTNGVDGYVYGYLSFSSNGTYGYVYGDTITFTEPRLVETPLPASATLLLAGLLGTLAMKRRQS